MASATTIPIWKSSRQSLIDLQIFGEICILTMRPLPLRKYAITLPDLERNSQFMKTPQTGSKQDQLRMIDNLIRAATCRVSCGDESGTGHLIMDCKVLTARHCIIAAIEATSAIELTFPGVDGEITLPARIVAQSEELDACILSVPTSLERPPVPLSGAMPREGSDWRSFGYPTGKTIVGHRISGTISHVLDAPKLKIDIDLSVDPNAILHSYRGLSGAAVISENFNIGMIRLKLDGTLGAISAQRLVEFLAQNGIEILRVTAEEAPSDKQGGTLADRSAFQKAFEDLIASNPGGYLFLEGAHGIGKTTFCNEFVPEEQALLNLGTYSILQPGRGPGAIYRAQPEILFDWLSTAVSELVTGKPSRKEERSYATLVSESSTLIEAFSQYCASTRRQGVLFIDGLNEAQVADSNVLGKLIGLLPPSLPLGVTIVLTAPNYTCVGVQLAGGVKGQNVQSLPPLSDEASSAYWRRKLSEKKASPVLVSRICEKAQGHPLYLRYLIEYANASPESDALDDFPTLTGSIEQYYETLWPRLLQDADAIQLLAIMARLRWGIRTSDLPKVLTPAEQAVFIPTVSRIRHLLLRPDSTTIYHPSFAAFLVSKTVDLDAVVHERLADFCLKHAPLDYCVLNVVFHLLHSGDSGRSLAVDACSQNWVDACVTLGVEPDVLLSDIDATLATAVMFGLPVEAVRMLLLSQRVSFRYNILFAQSARLMAEALIALKRPREALKHAIRFNTLIVDPEEALQIAFRLIQNECPEEALKLLGLLYQRIVEAYALDNIELQGFIRICSLQLRTLLFMRLADGRGRMRQIMGVLHNAARVLRTVLAEEPPELLEECIVRVGCLPTSYFLCFRDTYAGLAELKEMVEQAPNSSYLLHLVGALLECEQSLETYNLPKELASLPQMFSDIGEIVTGGADLDNRLVTPVANFTSVSLRS